ncbi:actin-like protein arp8 [Linnemannia zychae]|nr:actin-like protein arp8 [Linnemannia zychae]
MEDVNMEEAGPAVTQETTSTLPDSSGQSSSTPTSSDVPVHEQLQQQKEAADAIPQPTPAFSQPTTNVETNGDQNLNSNNNTETVASVPSETAPETAKAALATNVDTLNKDTNSQTAVAAATENHKDGSSAMDVDVVPPVATASIVVDKAAQDHPMESQPTEEISSNTTQPGASAEGASTVVEASSTTEQGKSSEMSIDSTIASSVDTTGNVKLETKETEANVVSGTEPSSTPAPSTAAVTEQASTSTTLEDKAEATNTAAPEPQAEPAGPPPKPVYVPQFKFTTFAPMTPIPVRNITTTFQKTEKNYVLKEIAAEKQRRRKRKVEQINGEMESETKAEGEEQANGSSTEGGASGLLKRKRGDEFSTIRKGIFADDDNEEEDKEDLENGDNGNKDDDEDEDEFSSDSDSEESVTNEMDENGEARSSADMGKKVIVIHPGSRNLRIGRASDAYPIVTPHCIARRTRVPPSSTSESGVVVESEAPVTVVTTTTEESSGGNQDKDDEMDVDEDEDEDETHTPVPDVINDRFLQEIEYDLKMRMKAAKRKPVNNAKSQVRSFNTSTRPERILDHNDPYKVEWTDPASEGEFIIGQKALNLPPGKHHNFRLFWPIVGGKLNEVDYPTPRVVVADMETIWTKVIQDDLGIDPKQFRKHYALLIIPDHYNKVYVTELIGMLLRSMQFRGVMVQQESVCATFGAGVSAACVVDIGAEITKVACVEDGICIPNSRAVLKYGGDDITRSFTALVKRTGFPYQELDLSQTYDWRLMEELKEKWCTMNEADLTVQVYSFFVRRPEKQTEKYQVKVYDEVALSPMCLFFPGVIRRWIEEREVKPCFTKLINHEDINDEDAPPIALMNQTSKKSNAAAAAAAAAARAGTPSLTIPGEDNAQASQTATPNATPAQTPAPSALLAASGPATASGTPAPYAATPAVVVPAEPQVIPFAMEPSVRTTDKAWETAGVIGKDHFSSLVALDVVVAQCISNCGSEERSKKLYGSIILVGGGGMIQGFDRVLEDRLFQALPATLTTVEKVEVLPAPREMDPRLLVWKGGSVLGKLDSSRELWIKPLEWELLGRKVLRDKALFVWSSKD